MGLFNSLFKEVTKKIDDAFEKTNGAIGEVTEFVNKAGEVKNKTINQETLRSKPAAQNVSVSGKMQNIIDTGKRPPKSSRCVKETFYDGEDADIEIEFSFMLSGDFLTDSTNAGEIDYCAAYEPDSDDDYASEAFDSDKPYFIITNAAENEIYELIEKYKNEGTPSNVYSFERVGDLGEKIYFRATTKLREDVLYFYAIDRGLLWENNYIGVLYPYAVRGTELEKKLMTIVDEAAHSYNERRI